MQAETQQQDDFTHFGGHSSAYDAFSALVEAMECAVSCMKSVQFTPRNRNGPPIPVATTGVCIFFGLTGEPTSEYPSRLSKPPKSGRELPESTFTRKKSHLFELDGESGSTIYFFLRYESVKGGEGPFGPILHAVIP